MAESRANTPQYEARRDFLGAIVFGSIYSKDVLSSKQSDFQVELLDGLRWLSISPEGILEIWTPCPGTVLTRLHGQTSVKQVDFLIKQLNAQKPSGELIHSFHDWWFVGSYRSKNRKKMSAWAAGAKNHLGPAHILLRSRFVEMGLSVANIATGGLLKPTSNRQVFRNAIQSHLKERDIPWPPSWALSFDLALKNHGIDLNASALLDA